MKIDGNIPEFKSPYHHVGGVYITTDDFIYYVVKDWSDSNLRVIDLKEDFAIEEIFQSLEEIDSHFGISTELSFNLEIEGVKK